MVGHFINNSHEPSNVSHAKWADEEGIILSWILDSMVHNIRYVIVNYIIVKGVLYKA